MLSFSRTQLIQIVIILLVNILQLTQSIDDDENFFFINNNKFFFNRMKNCQKNYYFDLNYFKCRLCDENFNLIASDDKLSCTCDQNSTEIFEYDNILKRPICERYKSPSVPSTSLMCPMRFVNVTKFSSLRRSIKIFKQSKPNCSCNDKLNENYKNLFCIKHELLKDLRNYQYFKYLPLTQTLNLNTELKFIVFFCKILHNQQYCNYLANLCVLMFYNLEKSSPCYLFYQQQQQSFGLDESTSLSTGDEAIEYDGGEKLKPFLYYRGNKYNKNLFEKVVDFQYNLNEDNINNTINFTITSYDLRGNLIDFRPMHLSDLNLCNLVSSPANKLGDRIRFARNFYQKCSINLERWFQIQNNMKFSTIFLNYFENNINFIQTIPVLIKNIIDYNEQDDMEKWQLVKRFYLVDTVSGRLNTVDADKADELHFYEKFSQISYVKSVELKFHLPDNDGDTEESNKIVIPLLKLEYQTLNMTEVSAKLKQNGSTLNHNDFYNVEFSIKITFEKNCHFTFHLEILLPILVILAFFHSLMQTFFYKIRQQKLEYDVGLLFNFFINLVSNIANAFFMFVVIFTIYVFVVYKTQTEYIHVMLPLEREENLIEILLYFALIFKFIKLLKLFYDMMSIDIFFIDWERPKFNNGDNFIHHTYNKSNIAQTASPETPSIASSLKPPTLSSPSPSYDCVSAWRNYFIANEWQELITKRKISIFLHSTFVASTLLIFGFENWTSIEYYLHFNHSNRQSYFQQYEIDPNSDDINGSVILKVAVGIIIYSVVYIAQRLYNYLIYERFIDNCLQQFIDVSSIANISVLILSMDSYGFYIHGRSPHGFSDTDMLSMIMQFKREEENLCGHRGLLAGSEQQTYTILAPRNLRNYYEKLIMPLHKNNNYHHQPSDGNFKKFETNFEKIILTYHNINRFFGAFIDHALKDVDYVIKEKSIFEIIFDCEMETLMTDSKGIFYLDNGHSFDKVLFYGNENTIFQFELILFVFILYLTKNFLIAILTIGIVFKVFETIVNYLTKRNLARKTLIDKRFLI